MPIPIHNPTIVKLKLVNVSTKIDFVKYIKLAKIYYETTNTLLSIVDYFI